MRRVTDRWLTIAYRLNSMTNNVVSLFTAPFTARTSEACHRTDDSPSLIGLTPWRTMWSVCSRLRLLRVQVRRVTDRWLTIAYRLNSMTNNVVSLFTAPFTVRTIVRRVTDQWLAIDKSTTSYPNEVFIIHAIRRGLDLKVRSTYCGKERETAIPLVREKGVPLVNPELFALKVYLLF